MTALLCIKTERVSFTWYAPQSLSGPQDANGHVRIAALRPGLTLLDGTQRAGVPDEAALDLAQEAGPALFEETTYQLALVGRDGAAVELRHRDPLLLGNIHYEHGQVSAHGSLNFRSQVGLSRFTILVDGRPELDLEVEVFPSKIDYQADYTAMLGEVHALAAGLALEHLRATYHLASTSGERRSSRLEWIALLRHVLGDLEPAMRQIDRHPIRGLRREHRMVRAEALRRSDARLRQAVRAGRGQGPAIATKNGLSVRRRLPELRPTPTLDTPEHRWLALQLQRVRQELAHIALEERRRQSASRRPGARGQTSARDAQALAELEQLEKRVTGLERLECMAAAEGAPPSGFASLQLQGAPGYKEAYRNLTILRQGLSIRGGPVELSVKDVHLLYEYWCFLALLRLVSGVLGVPIPADKLLEVRGDGLRMRLERGRTQSVPFALPGGRNLEVTYNPTFLEADALLPQQPDFVLTFSDPHWPTVRLVLDAKYRVETDPDFVDRFGAPSPPPDAINVLHRYRDAILESRDGEDVSSAEGTGRSKRTVVEGAALYPLTADQAERFDETRLWGSLKRLGIGALPFLPGSTGWVHQWLREVLLRCGWTIADAVTPHAAEVRRAQWQRSSEEPVLVGVLRGGEEATHLEWIERERRYYTRLTPSQPRQLRAKAVAFYMPGQATDGDAPGAVTHWAEVEEIEVLPRKRIRTPWPARRSQDELQVHYRLGPVQPLPRLISNRSVDGSVQRFSTNRWTSRLALLRATNVTELLLESAAEWALYEAIRAAGLELELMAVPPRPSGNSAIRGRAWFRVGRCLIRYIGGYRFEVTVGESSVRTLTLNEVVEELIRRNGSSET
ncbi:DUF2357 domain-containing protein [Ectothiorhodospiraceae bacterium WFHF3C12]|nr:DUF2357 domain-containing protein [Ectothiorhodospiraceae bacterium WFHF3C12]